MAGWLVSAGLPGCTLPLFFCCSVLAFMLCMHHAFWQSASITGGLTWYYVVYLHLAALVTFVSFAAHSMGREQV